MEELKEKIERDQKKYAAHLHSYKQQIQTLNHEKDSLMAQLLSEKKKVEELQEKLTTEKNNQSMFQESLNFLKTYNADLSKMNQYLLSQLENTKMNVPQQKEEVKQPSPVIIAPTPTPVLPHAPVLSPQYSPIQDSQNELFDALFTEESNHNKSRDSVLETGKSKIYVSPLPSEYLVDELVKNFSVFGEIVYAKILDHKVPGSGTFAFVEYKNPSDAGFAIQKTNNVDFLNNGNILSSRYVFETTLSQQTHSNLSKTNIFIRPIPKSFNVNDLVSKFSVFGPISFAKIYRADYAFLHFENAKDAQLAIEKTNGVNFLESHSCLKTRYASIEKSDPISLDKERKSPFDERMRSKTPNRSPVRQRSSSPVRFDFRRTTSRSPTRKRKRYSMSRSPSPKRKVIEVCSYFKKGFCRYGSKCNFSHIK
jgi:RNA recognition motif-containing protein